MIVVCCIFSVCYIPVLWSSYTRNIINLQLFGKYIMYYTTINNINIVQFDMETFKTKIILTVPVGQCYR